MWPCLAALESVIETEADNAGLKVTSGALDIRTGSTTITTWDFQHTMTTCKIANWR